jgi:virulence factor Mce-like protein
VRRLFAILAAGVVALLLGVLLTPAQGAGDYRVDVIFDDSQGLIPGQNVQIAGTKVGTIKDVVLTKDFKARIQMQVDGEFSPFKDDATCTIRPQGLIAEYYVDCDPGSPDGKALEGNGGTAPTVPVGHTSAPVPLTDLFDIFTAPVRDRLGLLLNTVGIGTAGLGTDFNELLRRANPTLKQANRVIAVLKRQKAALGTILDQTDDIVGKLADNGKTFTDFVDETHHTTQITAARQRELAETVGKLPALLDQLEPAMKDLNGVVTDGTPLVKALRTSAPDLNRLYADIGPFAREVRPTIKVLRPVLVQGANTLKRSAPLTRVLRSYAHNSLPASELGAKVFTNLRDTGSFENLLGVFYTVAGATARFDEKSHLLPAFAMLNQCAVPASTPVAACSANFSATPNTRRTRATRKAATQQPGAAPAAGAPAAAAPAAAPSAPKTVPLLPVDPIKAVTDAIDKVLAPVKDPLKKLLAPKEQRDQTDRGLLGFLLG